MLKEPLAGEFDGRAHHGGEPRRAYLRAAGTLTCAPIRAAARCSVTRHACLGGTQSAEAILRSRP